MTTRQVGVYAALTDENGVPVSSSAPLPVVSINSASEVFLGLTGQNILTPTATFTRPADTTAYTSGDLIANSVTAGSVTNMSATVTRVAAAGGFIDSIHVMKSDKSVTTCTIRVHVWNAAPTYVTGGDNSAMSTVLATAALNHLGAFDAILTSAGADGAFGMALPQGTNGQPMPFKLASGSTLFFTLEAQSAYTPASAEVFTIRPNIRTN